MANYKNTIDALSKYLKTICFLNVVSASIILNCTSDKKESKYVPISQLTNREVFEKIQGLDEQICHTKLSEDIILIDSTFLSLSDSSIIKIKHCLGNRLNLVNDAKSILKHNSKYWFQDWKVIKVYQENEKPKFYLTSIIFTPPKSISFGERRLIYENGVFIMGKTLTKGKPKLSVLFGDSDIEID